MVWSMLLLQMPSLSRKQGSLTTDSRESCLIMLFNLSVFRFWYISWLRSCRKWLTLGLVGLVGSPPVGPRPWPPATGSSQPLARSRQQLQQSRPMGERQSSSDISEDAQVSGGEVWWMGGKVKVSSPELRVTELSPSLRAAPVPELPLLWLCFAFRLLFRGPTSAQRVATVSGERERENALHTFSHTHTYTCIHTCTHRFSRSALKAKPRSYLLLITPHPPLRLLHFFSYLVVSTDSGRELKGREGGDG